MATTLERPERSAASEVVGDDGLTDAEREAYAARFQATAGSKVLSKTERAVLDRLRGK
jgi:hypothetical protein